MQPAEGFTSDDPDWLSASLASFEPPTQRQQQHPGDAANTRQSVLGTAGTETKRHRRCWPLVPADKWGEGEGGSRPKQTRFPT